jgi:Rrf2 family nitric oxide-sensitive transcriptional repressor
VHRLVGLGFINSQPGRSGGLQLSRPAEHINIGDLVRQLEADAVFLECFDGGAGTCRLIPKCQLKAVLGEALEAFYNVLDRFTLAQVTTKPAELRALLALVTHDE